MIGKVLHGNERAIDDSLQDVRVKFLANDALRQVVEARRGRHLDVELVRVEVHGPNDQLKPQLNPGHH